MRRLSISRSLEDRLSTIAILYFMIGLVFAICFAFYYHWEWFAFFSPNFFFVVFTWPYQAIGFMLDIFRYGPFGKPVI